MKGEKIHSIGQLFSVLLKDKCVCYTGFYGDMHRLPVAFLVSMQCRVVNDFVQRGLYVYKPAVKSKSPWKIKNDLYKQNNKTTKNGNRTINN